MLSPEQKLPEAVPGLVREELHTECLIFNPETLQAVCLSSEGCLILNMCQQQWTCPQALAELADLGYEHGEELLLGTLAKLHQAGLTRSAPDLTTRRQLLESTAKLVAASVVAFVSLPQPAAAASCVPFATCSPGAGFAFSIPACNAIAGVPCCLTPGTVCGYIVCSYGSNGVSDYGRTCVSTAAPTCSSLVNPPAGTQCQCG